jgi:hypothetical protein
MTTSELPDQVFTCPRCKSPTNLEDNHCHVCGVNLVLAVARGAAEMLSATKQEVGLLYEADKHLPRFGEFLMRNGDILKAQLEAALERQRATPGQPRTVGQILLEMGAVNREQLDKASIAQIRELQDAVEQGRRRVKAQDERIGKLEFAVRELAELSQSVIAFVEKISTELQTPLKTLNASAATRDESLKEVLAELERLNKEMRDFASGERG